MFEIKSRITVAAFAASTALSLLAGCASTPSVSPALGTPARGHSYDRRVSIKANTKFVNIDAGEVIKFIVREPDGTDRSCAWNFNVVREAVGDLSTIAPAGILDRHVTVVVGPNPHY